jgi:fibronectin-binding autotransporter adhesin
MKKNLCCSSIVGLLSRRTVLDVGQMALLAILMVIGGGARAVADTSGSTWFLHANTSGATDPALYSSSVWWSDPVAGSNPNQPAINKTDTYDSNGFNFTISSSTGAPKSFAGATIQLDGVGAAGTAGFIDATNNTTVGNVVVTSAGGYMANSPPAGGVQVGLTMKNLTLDGALFYKAASSGTGIVSVGITTLAGSGNFTIFGAGTTRLNVANASAYTGTFTLGGAATADILQLNTANPIFTGTLNFGGSTTSATASTTNASKIVTVASTSGLYAGETVVGTGVSTTIAEILSPTSFLLTANATTTSGSNSLAFSDTGFMTFDLNGVNEQLNGVAIGSAVTTPANVIIKDNIATAATLTINNDSTTTNADDTFGGIISTGTGVVSLTKAGNKTLTLSGANTYTGVTNIQNGTLSVSTLNKVSGGAASSSLGAPTTVANGTIGLGATTTTGTLLDTGASEVTDRVINLAGTTGGGTLDKSGSGTLEFTSAFTATGAGIKTLTLQGSATGQIDGAIVDNSGTNKTSVTKAGTGTWILEGANTYTGATTVNGGTLNLGGSTANGSINGATGAPLALGGGTLSYTRTGNTTQNFTSTAINPGASAVTAVAGDTVTLGAITRNIGGTVDFGTTGTITTTTANANPAGGQQTILGGYATVGGNTWAVSGTGATPGTITGLASYNPGFAAGTDVDAATGTTTPGAMTINSLRFNTAGSYTVNTAGNLVIATGGILETSTVGSNAVAINNNTLEGAAGNDLVVIQNNTNVGGGMTIGSVIADNTTATGLTKSGAGALTLSGPNTYTGATTINGGTVTAGVAQSGTTGAFGNNSALILANNATTAVDITGFNTQIGSLTGGGTLGGNITLGAATLTTGGDNTSPAAYAGVISSSTGGSLIKIGTGTQTLSGANTYNGTTTVSNGILNIQNATGLGSTAAGTTVANGATLQLQGGVTVGAEALTISGAGATGSGATGALENVNGISTYGGLITLGADSTISSDANTLNLTNPGTITGAGFGLTLTGTGNGSIAGIIGTTSGALTKTGAGTWILSGANTYGGTTTISGGTLSISNVNNLGTGSSAVALSGAGDLSYTGNTASFTRGFTLGTGGGEIDATNPGQTLTIQTGAITGTGNALTVGGAGVMTLASNITTGTGGTLTKTGTGIVTLSGANTYTGATTISNGILIVSNITGSNNNLGNGSSPVVLGSATTTGILTYSGTSTTYSNGFTLGGAGGGEIDTFKMGQTLTIQTGNITGTGFALTVGSSGNTTIASNITTGTSGTLIKTGIGTLTLSGANTYTGLTTILGGTLSVSNFTSGGNLGTTGGITFGAGVFDPATDTLVYTGSGESTGRAIQIFKNAVIENDGSGTLTFTNSLARQNISNGGSQNLTLQGTANGVLSGAITAATGDQGLTLVKAGTDTWTLTSNSNSYQGSTTINGGTLDLGGSTATGAINSASVLKLGGGTFTYTRTGNQTQTFASTTINPGASFVNTNNSNDIINLAAITRNVGGTVDFGSTGTINTPTLANPVSTTNNLLGGWATVNGTDWAVSNGDGTNPQPIVALASGDYTNDTWAAANDTTVTLASNTAYTNVTTDSLRFNNNAADTVSLAGTNVIAMGGILVTNNVGGNASAITGGTLEGAVNQDLVVIQNNTNVGGGMTIGSIIADNTGTTGASSTGTALTKSGLGTLTVSGANTYTGSTYVNAGTLALGNSAALGFGGVTGLTASSAVTTVVTGAALDLGGQTGVNNVITLNGTGISGAGALTNSGGAASIGSGVTALTLTAVGSGYSAPPTVTLTGTGSGATAVALLGITTSSVTLSGGSGYTVAPTVVITGGGGTGATATAVITGSGAAAKVTAIVVTNAGTGYTSAPTFTLVGGTFTTATTATGVGNKFAVSGLEMTGAGSGYTSAPTVTFTAGTTTATATPVLTSVILASNSSIGGTGDISIAAPVSGAFALTKVGGNTLTLSGANTYTGGTFINGGVLNVGIADAGGVGLAATSGALGDASDSGTGAPITFGGGTLQYSAAAASSDYSSRIVNSTSAVSIDTNGQNVTYATGLSSNNTGGLTKLGAGSLNLSGANAYTGATTVAAGNLQVTGSLASGSAVTVGNNTSTAAILSGTGTINGSLATATTGSNIAYIAPGSNISGTRTDFGAVGTLHVGNLGFTVGNGTQFDYDINTSTAAGSTFNDEIVMSGGTLSLGSSIVFNFNQLSALSTIGSYTLIDDSAGTVSAFNASNFSATGIGSDTATFSVSGNQLLVSFSAPGASTNYYFTGATSNDFTLAGNYNTLISGGSVQSTPLSSTSDVYIAANSPANLPPTIGSSVAINSLTFNANAAGSSLDGTGTLTLSSSGTALTDAATGGTTETVNAPVALGASQTWSVTNSSNTLADTGGISGSGKSLTLTGGGTFNFTNGSSSYSGGTMVNTGTKLLINNTSGTAALGTGALIVQQGAAFGGKGNASGLASFAIGSGGGGTAAVQVGAGGSDTTSSLTLQAAGASTIANANLTFNLNTAVAGQGNQLSVGATALTFGSNVTLTLNLVGANVIAANTPYILVAGIGGNGDGTLAGSQFAGGSLGTNGTINGNLVLTGLTMSFTGSEPPSWYNGNSYFFLVNQGGVDDIEVEVVPEPSTWAMMLGGLAFLIFIRSHRKRRSQES